MAAYDKLVWALLISVDLAVVSGVEAAGGFSGCSVCTLSVVRRIFACASAASSVSVHVSGAASD